MATKRLSKTLAAAGIASRRACESIIQAGRVCVNGELALLPQTLVDEEKDTITLDGVALHKSEHKVYFVLNKPSGYLCTNAPLKNAKRVIDLFHAENLRLFTVGRLDKDTTGLLIVTNDGHFAHRVIHPSSNIEKEYLVKVDQEITAEHLKAISHGAPIEGVFVKPLSVKKVRRGTLKITIMEGKKREVRQLLTMLRFKVLELKRIRIGQLVLGTLPLGAYRSLSQQEIHLLFPVKIQKLPLQKPKTL